MSDNAWTLEHFALAAASLGAWDWDAVRDRVTWSPRVYELFGVDAQDFGHTLKDFLALIHPDDRAGIDRWIGDMTQAAPSDWQRTFRAARRDRDVWLSVHGRVLHDDDGKTVRLAGVVQDVSDSYRAERERREQASLMQAALDASSFAVVVMDATGHISYCNELGAELLGQTRDAVVQRTYDAAQFNATALDGTPLPHERLPFFRVIHSGEAVRGIEYCIERADGVRVALRINCAPIKNERGEIKWVVASFEDITERRAIEDAYRQAQKMEAIGRLAGGVAHDFNNVMTAILSFVALARRSIQNVPTVRDSLDGITEVGERAVRLTRQLLLLGRREITQPVPIEVRRALQDAAGFIERVLGERVKLELALDAEPCWVNIDPDQLQQVFFNLAMNARAALMLHSHGAHGAHGDGQLSTQPCLHIGVARQLQLGQVTLRVCDNGHGMDERTRLRAFEPFFTTKAAHEGTGLGLATCHRIITQAGGDIALWSELGLGTRVDIALPAVSAPASNDVSTSLRARGKAACAALTEPDSGSVRE